MQITGTLGSRISALRSEKHISQQALAERLFVTQGTVSKWEKGFRFPDANMIREIAKQLDVDPALLFSAPPTDATTPSVILVEDEPLILNGALCVLREELPHADVAGFHAAADALAFAEAGRIDLAFLDIELHGESGLDLASRLGALNPYTNVVFLTSHSEYALEALGTFCSGYMLKPLTSEKLHAQLSHLRYPLPGNVT